jgi:protein-S-isoprenylcysteine O-methyltransferase Ste14
MKALELKVPPVVLFLGCAALGWALGRFAPVLPLPVEGAWAWAHRGLLAIALVVLFASQWAFFRGKTTVNPKNPAAARKLLTDGVFALSRNPVYLAMLLTLVALAWQQGQGSGLLGAVLFHAWVTRWQIVPEERILAERFGDDYREYCARVRRWL